MLSKLSKQIHKKIRGLNCEYASKVVRMNEAEDQVFAFLTHIRLPKDWQAEIERLVENMDTVRQIENRRAQIDEELRQVGRAYADGVYTEVEYEQRRIKLIAEKDSWLYQMARVLLKLACGWKAWISFCKKQLMTKNIKFCTSLDTCQQTNTIKGFVLKS